MDSFPDIYFLPKWCKLHEAKDNGQAGGFSFENQNGAVYYPFVKRSIDITIDGKAYFDLITPYGFNGPIILQCHENKREQLVNDWFDSFLAYCKNNNIIAEYVRFNPWCQNHADFKNFYELIYNKYTFAVNLENDFFAEEFTTKCRNQIRKSIKNGVKIEFDFTGETLGEFYCIYQKTIERRKIKEYYQHSFDFLKNTFETLKNNIFIINAKFNNQYISAGIFCHYGDYLHYRYSANDSDFFYLSANSNIIYEACKWGENQGKKQLHLGGGTNEDDSLFRFKKNFTSNTYDFYIGKSIRDPGIYKKFIAIKGENPDYFPSYRT